jgi:hypothetical protein
MRSLRALVVAVLLGIATTAPAQAGTVYAYWSYWQGDTGTWKYATTGPATAPAVDGAVDGWRFTLGSSGHADQPTPAPDFNAICGTTVKLEGSVRVALVIDYGIAADAVPITHCAVVDAGLSRASALSAVASLRLNDGFICAINDIPRTGCGDAVAAPSASASASTSPTTTPTPSGTPKQASTGTPVAPTDSASSTPVASASASATAPSTPASTGPAPSAPSDDPGSPLATIVTVILGGVALALALRNARRQQESR